MTANMVKVLDRITELRRCAEEDGEKINEKSVSSFIDFVTDKYYEGEPTISLTPDNEVYATWGTNKKNCFRFHGDGSIKHFTMEKHEG